MERIKITGTGSEMQGVGRMADGIAVFVPGALPGETVDIEITRRAERFCEGRLIGISDASPDRQESECPYYSTCGGCQGRHMRYSRTLSLKRERVRDALVRLGGLENPNVPDTLGCTTPERYRNKAEYAIEIRNGHVIIGSRGTDKHVCDIDDCLLQRGNSIDALRVLKELLAGDPSAGDLRGLVTRETRSGEMMMILTGVSANPNLNGLQNRLEKRLPSLKSLYYCRLKARPTHALDGECRHIWGKNVLSECLMGLDFSLSPQSFFQVNPDQAERLYSIALEAAGCDAGTKRILDAYCGVGTMTLAAAQSCAAVGVEIVPPAIRDANDNAKRNGLSGNARFILGDAAREIPKLIGSGEHFDAVIVDPPRKGCDKALLDSLISMKIPRISYVSCDPATLARDIKLLVQGGYRLEWAQPVDMFPWTAHVETVALMTRHSP